MNVFLIFIFFYLLSLFIVYVPINPSWFFKNYNIEMDENNIIGKGCTTIVYHKKGDSFVTKQLCNLGIIKDEHCTKCSFANKLSILRYIECLIKKYYTWKSVKKIYNELYDIKYFSKIYNINNKKHRYEQEYIPVLLNETSCPNNIEKQLDDLNDILISRNYYIHDIRLINCGVSNGILKIIDCEILNSIENKIYNKVTPKVKSKWDRIYIISDLIKLLEKRKRLNKL